MNNMTHRTKRGMKAGAIKRGSGVYVVLKIVSAAALVGVAVAVLAAAPGLAIAGRSLMKDIKKSEYKSQRSERQKMRRSLNRLREERLVEFVERKGETYVVITDKGKLLSRQFDIDDLYIKKPKRWDGKWRMVLFDIHEEDRKAREAIRIKLYDFGFYPLQKSVFVCPYDCQEEIAFVARYFDVEQYVQYVVCESLGVNERKVRNHFKRLLL
jgi:DNA-binding transcriptional regulator PaaX